MYHRILYIYGIRWMALPEQDVTYQTTPSQVGGLQAPSQGRHPLNPDKQNNRIKIYNQDVTSKLQ